MYVNIKQRSEELRTKHIASSSHRAYVERARHTVRTMSAKRVRQLQRTFVLVTLVLTSPQ